MYIRHDIKQRSQQSSPSGIFDTYDMLYLWRSLYIMIYERGARGEVVNAIDLYIYDRTLHEWIHRRDVGYPQLILQVCRYDRLYVNQTLCLYMTTTLFINSPYHTRWCYNINDDSNLVDWILIDERCEFGHVILSTQDLVYPSRLCSSQFRTDDISKW